MKNTKRIVALLLILTLIIGGLTFVKAATDENTTLNISKGVKQGNIVTFTITLPKGGGLNGDINGDGKVDVEDVKLLQDFVLGKDVGDNFNNILADCTNDNDINTLDLVELKRIVDYNSDDDKTNDSIILNGTLAKDSTYKMSKNSDGTYKVQVTIPSDKDGTIGITAKPKVFKYSSTVANEEVSSDLLTVSKDNEYELNIKISDGVIEENKVTFKIEAPKGTGLKGDINGDGKVDVEDVKLLQDFVLGKDVGDNFNNILADCTNDNDINTLDLVELKRIVDYNSDDDKTNDSIILNGTLAKDSTYELVKDVDGNYKIVVTIPENATTGTIGVKLQGSVMKTTNAKVNKEVSSSEFDLSKKDDSNKFKVIDEKQENTSDGKVKVTITVNKELDKDKLPEGWTLSEDAKSISKVMNKDEKINLTLVAKDGSTLEYSGVAKVTNGDKTTAPTKIPQTGIKNTIIVVIGAIAIIGTVVFIRSRKMLK